jgi:hypothetical protein
MNVMQVGVECHSNMMVARYATQDNRQHILAFYISYAVQEVEFV